MHLVYDLFDILNLYLSCVDDVQIIFKYISSSYSIIDIFRSWTVCLLPVLSCTHTYTRKLSLSFSLCPSNYLSAVCIGMKWMRLFINTEPMCLCACVRACACVSVRASYRMHACMYVPVRCVCIHIQTSSHSRNFNQWFNTKKSYTSTH